MYLLHLYVAVITLFKWQGVGLFTIDTYTHKNIIQRACNLNPAILNLVLSNSPHSQTQIIFPSLLVTY